MRADGRAQLSPVQSLVAGGIGGVLAKTLVAPLERTKILFHASDQPFRLRAMPGLLLRIWRAEGPAALWKGHAATVLRAFPLAAIKFATFDTLKTGCVHRGWTG